MRKLYSFHCDGQTVTILDYTIQGAKARMEGIAAGKYFNLVEVADRTAEDVWMESESSLKEANEL